MKGRFILILGLFLLFLIPLISAAEDVAVNVSSVYDNTAVLRQTFYSEELKTRSDIKLYIDTKSDILIKSVTEKAQGFIDKNTQIFEDRNRAWANLFLIRLCISIISSILVAWGIILFIRGMIRRFKKQYDKIKDGLEDGF